LVIFSCERSKNKINTKLEGHDISKSDLTIDEIELNKLEVELDIDSVINNKLISTRSLHTRYYSKVSGKAKSKMMYLVMIKDSMPVWLVHPASDYGLPYPAKGISTSSNSVLVKAPYESGAIAYSGLFENNIAKGEHCSYHSKWKT